MLSFSPIVPRSLQIRCGFARRFRVLLHAGLHKTGTSAVQTVFAASADRLRRKRFLYPHAGRPDGLDGHHNVAWQLAGDHRFQAEFGTVDDVAAEIGRFPGDAVLSSEDFESTLGTPEKLLPLIHHPALRGREVVLLVYVRDQVSYLESLFLEMLRHGMAEDACSFCDAVIAQGEVGFEEWEFQLDYDALRSRIRLLDLRLIVRPYAGLFKGSTVRDLLRIAGCSRGRRIAGSSHRINERDSIARSLALFSAHRLGQDVDAIEPRIDELLGARLAGRRAHLSPRRRRVVRDRFADSNERIARAFGFPPRMLECRDEPPSDAVDLEALFSNSTVEILRDWLNGRISDAQAAGSVFARAGPAGEAAPPA